MNYETVFSIANTLALVFWIVLLFWPKSSVSRMLFRSEAAVLLFAILYTTLFMTAPASEESGSFFTLAGVMSLFQQPVVALAGWIHYLAFDLFVGIHIEQKLRDGSARLWVRLPILGLTFMLGPVGYLAYRIWHWLHLNRSNSHHQP